MIELTNMIFADKNFQETLNKINNCEGLSSNFIYFFMDLQEEYVKRGKLFDASKLKLLNEYGEKIEGKEERYKVLPENVQIFEEKFSDLLNIQFELNMDEIEYEEILQFSINNMITMKNIIKRAKN